MEAAVNLINQELRENPISDVVVKVGAPPSYVKCFTKEHSTDVILIYVLASSEDGTKYRSNYTFISEADVTGQPLELPKSEDITIDTSVFFDYSPREEDSHRPLSLFDARNIINACNIDEEVTPAIWVLTDGQDYRKMVLLGSEKSRQFFRRSWAHHSEFTNFTFNESFFKERHASILRTSDAKCEVESSYSVPAKYGADESPNSSTCFKLSWNLISFDPPFTHKSFEAQLITKCLIGQRGGPWSTFFGQLVHVHNLFRFLVENRANTRMLALPEIDLTDMFPQFDNSITIDMRVNFALSDSVFGYREIADVSLANVVAEVLGNSYQESHVISKLWYLLVGCKSSKELTVCIDKLLVESQIRPCQMLHVGSRLAAAMSAPGTSLLSTEPLEVMIEVGLDKLRSDFMAIISKSKILAQHSLKIPKIPPFRSVKPAQWTNTVNEMVTWMSQLYTVLDLLMNLQMSLDLRGNELFQFASSASAHFIGPSSPISSIQHLISNPLQSLTVNVPVKLIESKLPKDFDEWRMTLTSRKGSETASSIFYSGSQSFFPNYFQPVPNESILKDTTVVDCPPVHFLDELHTVTTLYG